MTTGGTIAAVGGGVILLGIVAYLVLKPKAASAATGSLPLPVGVGGSQSTTPPTPPVYTPTPAANSSTDMGAGTPDHPWSKETIASITDAGAALQQIIAAGANPPPIAGGIGKYQNKPAMK